MSEPSPVDRAAHWETVWTTRDADDVSWFQQSPAMSLELIASISDHVDSMVDIGGGASSLVDALLNLNLNLNPDLNLGLDRAVGHVAVLDVSAAALATSQERLGDRANNVEWIVSDLLAWAPQRSYGLWHDRAVLHFMTDGADQDRYAAVVDAALSPGGHVVIGTFAPNGPEFCSGLPVQRHDAASVIALLERSGRQFELVTSRSENHVTPGGAVQKFTWVAARG